MTDSFNSPHNSSAAGASTGASASVHANTASPVHFPSKGAARELSMVAFIVSLIALAGLGFVYYTSTAQMNQAGQQLAAQLQEERTKNQIAAGRKYAAHRFIP
ncbi:MAG: hypothetical protein HC848_10270 [Limnobacter sp.]|nr:hypothetical protein [Limnobacter sp.]